MSTMDDTKWKQVLAEEEANIAEADAEVERLEQLRERLQQRVTAWKNLVEVLHANPVNNVVDNFDSFVERPVRDGPWSARVSGREAPRAVGADLTALGAALRTSRIPCSTPSVAQGARWKLWSGALTRLRPQVPSGPPAEPCFPSPPGVHGPSA